MNDPIVRWREAMRDDEKSNHELLVGFRGFCHSTVRIEE